MCHDFPLETETTTEIPLTVQVRHTPIFPEFPELARLSKEFRLDDSILEEVKKVIIEAHRLQLKQLTGRGTVYCLREAKN